MSTHSKQYQPRQHNDDTRRQRNGNRSGKAPFNPVTDPVFERFDRLVTTMGALAGSITQYIDASEDFKIEVADSLEKLSGLASQREPQSAPTNIEEIRAQLTEEITAKVREEVRSELSDQLDGIKSLLLSIQSGMASDNPADRETAQAKASAVKKALEEGEQPAKPTTKAKQPAAKGSARAGSNQAAGKKQEKATKDNLQLDPRVRKIKGLGKVRIDAYLKDGIHRLEQYAKPNQEELQILMQFKNGAQIIERAQELLKEEGNKPSEPKKAVDGPTDNRIKMMKNMGKRRQESLAMQGITRIEQIAEPNEAERKIIDSEFQRPEKAIENAKDLMERFPDLVV